MARKKYLGRANEELDAMFAELESIDKGTKTGRRKHRALSNKIRRKRERRVLSGIRSLFGSRKYPVPAAASGAASTMGFPGVPEMSIGIGRELGMGTMAEADVPETVALPEIEEITVDAKRRELAELPVTQSRSPSLRAQVPFGIYTGELAEQFGNEPEIQQSMMSKLGRNQLRSLERRKRKVAQYPDAYPPDYATPEGMFKYAEGRTIEGNRMIGEGGTLFDTTDPTDYGLMALGMAPIPGARMAAGVGKLRKLAKLKSAMNPKNMKFDPIFTGADTPLTWAQLGARAKTKSGVTALQPTKESLELLADAKLFKGVQKLGLGVTGIAGIGANREIANRDKDKEEIKKLTEEEMEAMEQMLAEIEREKAFYGDDIDAWSPENMNSNYAGGGQLTGHAQQLANAGRGEDSMLMHVTPSEVQGIASLAPGMMTINPQTGLPEAGFFKDILGFALPFLGTMVGVPPWLTGALGAKLRGGDFKDMLLGAGTGALMGKFSKGLSDTGNVENLLADPTTFDPSVAESITGAVPEHVQALAGTGGITLPTTASTMGVGALTKAGLDPSLLAQGTGGVDPMTFLETTGGATPKQLGMFKETFAANNPFDWKGATAGDKFGALKGAGLGGLQDQLMTLPGLGTIAGTGLGAQRDMTRRWDQSILDREEQRKKEEEEIYRMNPENIPYRGGGSLYKNRYINGNWG